MIHEANSKPKIKPHNYLFMKYINKILTHRRATFM